MREPDDTLASSPTIADALGSHPTKGWGSRQQRRLSNASSSVHSDELENIKWQSFDGPGGFDDSGVVLEEEEDEDEDEEEHDHFPGATNGDDVENDRWLDGQSDVDDGDMYSSAALSRRAEMILANAKKRLNVRTNLLCCQLE